MALVPARRPDPPQPPPTASGVSAWTARDEALAYTCRLVHAAATGGDLDPFPVLATTFAPMAPTERVWAAGWFRLFNHQPVGDGAYRTNSFVVGGTGMLGAGMLVGTLIASGLSRQRAEAQARADLVPRWVVVETGQLWVSSHGWRMVTPRLLAWPWAAVTSAQVAAPGVVALTGETGGGGNVSWLLESDWAELVFGLWAVIRHPRHPQLAAGGWLPAGWASHAAAHGRPVPVLQ